MEKRGCVPETPTDVSVFCSHSQLASEIICLNRRDRTSQEGLLGSRNVGISRMQLLDTYRGAEATSIFAPTFGKRKPNRPKVDPNKARAELQLVPVRLCIN